MDNIKKISLINEVINKTSQINIKKDFSYIENDTFCGWQGKIEVKNKKKSLTFAVTIPYSYPFSPKISNKPVKFKCPDVAGYPHIMPDNSLCLHPEPSFDFKEKLLNELTLLLDWVNKYYVNEETDEYYEFPIIPDTDDSDFFYFTDTPIPIKRKTWGLFSYKQWPIKKLKGNNYLIISFRNEKVEFNCNWSSTYNRFCGENINFGIYFCIKGDPFKERVKIAKKWEDIEKYFNNQEMKGALFRLLSKHDYIVHILIGYHTSNKNTHWLAVKREKGEIPLSQISGENNYIFKSTPIKWCGTKNISYERYFGRGKLSDDFTSKRIGIIGLGAIGSNLAEILIRSGVRDLGISDFDIVQPGNICRSQYYMHHINYSKDYSLFLNLLQISPFCEVESFTIKKTAPDDVFNKITSVNIDTLNKFDIIFDCSTDNELCYYLDKIKPDTIIINMSISDEAKELVVLCGNNISEWKKKLFQDLNPIIKLFYPGTGCWDPTFKASYIEIRMLIDYAVAILDNKLKNYQILNNFIIRRIEEDLTVRMEVVDY